MTETSTTDTRIYLKVPNPFTALAVGKFYDDSSTNGVDYAGISVNADDHVRLYAKGSASSSDAILQSYGQAWLQAKNRMAGVAPGSVMIGSAGKTVLGSKDGVNILAGFQTTSPSSEGTPGTRPDAIEGYESKATIASALWTGFDVSMGIVATAAGIVQALVGPGFTWFSAQKAAANLAGAAIGIATLGWSKEVTMLPGVNMFSQGGTYFGALYGSVNITGFVGLLMGSLFHTKLAIGMTRLRGFKRASVSAVGPVDFSGLLWYDSRSNGEQWIASRTGTLTARGAEMILGQMIATPPQLPTSKLEFDAINEISIESPIKVKFDAASKIKSTAMLNTTMTCLGTADLSVAGGLSTLTVDLSTAKVGIMNARLEVTKTAVELSCEPAALIGMTNKFEIGLSDIELSEAKGVGKMTIVPGVSVTVDGLTLDIG